MSTIEEATAPTAARPRRRVIPGIVLTLLALAAAIAAVLVLAENSVIGLQPDNGKLAVEFTLAAAVALGYALGAAVEGWIRGDDAQTWFEAFFYRLGIAVVVVFGAVAAGVVLLERAGIGPQPGL